MDMSAEVAQATIFVPVLVLAALTVVAFLRMAVARGRAAKVVDANFYRTYQGTPGEPDYAVIAVRHYGNVLELPPLFYVGCIIAFVLGAVTPWMLVFAWGFVALRLIQSAIHLTSNKPAIRGMAFALSWIFLIALWVDIAREVLAKI